MFGKAVIWVIKEFRKPICDLIAASQEEDDEQAQIDANKAYLELLLVGKELKLKRRRGR